MARIRKGLWDKYAFEIIFFICLIIFILFIIFKKQIESYLKTKVDDQDFHRFLKVNHVNKKRQVIPKKNENRCRDIFETIFKKPFPNCRPDIMTRKLKGTKLELDGYNQELKLAFEYNGPQHYKFIPMFHKNYEDFIKQVQRDKEKRELCKEHNITLIEIPYTVKYEELYNYIVLQLNELNII